MKKTFDDYMNDPDIINEPMGLRITHAMRFKVQDETKGMTATEHTAYYNKTKKPASKKERKSVKTILTAASEELRRNNLHCND